MIYPWMFDEYKLLRPLKGAAEELAQYDRWSQLYELTALNHNRVPCAAALYFNDMYVDRTISEQTAAVTNQTAAVTKQTAAEIKGLQLWVTNEFEHSALRLNGEPLLDRLLRMLSGVP